MQARAGTGIVALALVAALSGCMRRSIFVRTDPDGARVFLDGEDMGRSPRKIPFQHYGTREIVVRAPDRETARVLLDVDAPWYQWTPFDLFADVLVPWTIDDERQVFVALEFDGAPFPPPRCSLH